MAIIKEKEIERLIEQIEEEKSKIKEEELSIEDKAKLQAKLIEKERRRHEMVLAMHKILTKGVEMPEEQYLKYITIFDDPNKRNGYNLADFIAGDDGQPEPAVFT